MLEIYFKLAGILGLLLITAGVLSKQRKRQDLFFIAGGILLEAYSLYLQDWIFGVLQIVFVLAAIWRLTRK